MGFSVRMRRRTGQAVGQVSGSISHFLDDPVELEAAPRLAICEAQRGMEARSGAKGMQGARACMGSAARVREQPCVGSCGGNQDAAVGKQGREGNMACGSMCSSSSSSSSISSRHSSRHL